MLITEKIYILEHTAKTPQLQLYVREFFCENGLTLYTWPGGVLLAAFVASRSNEFFGSSCLELGSGTGLPAIVAAKIGAKHCVLTERNDTQILTNLRLMVTTNNVSHCTTVMALDWHQHDLATLCTMTTVDFILGADVFYSSEDFDPVLSIVETMTRVNPQTIFYTTYQERSSRRTLCPLLDKYGLQAEVIPLSSFLHSGHETGFSNVCISFDSLMLLKIVRKADSS